jgi:hypothetical protein
MIKIGKKIYAVFAVAFLFASFACLPQVLKVYSADVSASDRTQAFLRDVVLLDLSRYTQVRVVNNERVRPDLGNLTEDSGQIVLQATGSTLYITFSYINGSLAFLKLDPGKNHLFYISPPNSSNLIEEAEDFLDRFQTFSGESSLSFKKSMLSGVLLTQPTSIVTSGNFVLTTAVDQNETEFYWRYTVSGAVYSSFSFGYKNGDIAGVSDDSSYIKIGDTSVNISSQEAIDIASKYINDLNVSYPLVKWAFSTKLGTSTTDTEPLTMYPYYEVDMPVSGGGYVVVQLWAKDGRIIRWYDMPGGGGIPSPGTSPIPSLTPSPLPSPSSILSPSPSTSPSQTSSLSPLSSLSPTPKPTLKPIQTPSPTLEQRNSVNSLPIITGVIIIIIVVLAWVMVYFKKIKK